LKKFISVTNNIQLLNTQCNFFMIGISKGVDEKLIYISILEKHNIIIIHYENIPKFSYRKNLRL